MAGPNRIPPYRSPGGKFYYPYLAGLGGLPSTVGRLTLYSQMNDPIATSLEPQDTGRPTTKWRDHALRAPFAVSASDIFNLGVTLEIGLSAARDVLIRTSPGFLGACDLFKVHQASISLYRSCTHAEVCFNWIPPHLPKQPFSSHEISDMQTE